MVSRVSYVWTSYFLYSLHLRINCKATIFSYYQSPFFSERVLNVRNALPGDVIDFISVKKFRCSLLNVNLSSLPNVLNFLCCSNVFLLYLYDLYDLLGLYCFHFHVYRRLLVLLWSLICLAQLLLVCCLYSVTFEQIYDMIYDMIKCVLPATRQRWLSCLYPSHSWYSIYRPRGNTGLGWRDGAY